MPPVIDPADDPSDWRILITSCHDKRDRPGGTNQFATMTAGKKSRRVPVAPKGMLMIFQIPFGWGPYFDFNGSRQNVVSTASYNREQLQLLRWSHLYHSCSLSEYVMTVLMSPATNMTPKSFQVICEDT
jgi:hypothetical protein